jgi:MFS family permease
MVGAYARAPSASLLLRLGDRRGQGRHFGTLNLAAGAGAGLGPWVAGLLYDRTGSYAPAFWLAMAGSVVSVGAIWLAAPRKVRRVAGRVRSASG